MPNLETELNQIKELRNKLNKHQPLSPDQRQRLAQNVRIDHVWSSNAIEGSPLSRAETATILNSGITAADAANTATVEAIDLNEAYVYMMALAQGDRPVVITHALMRDLNRLLTRHTTIPQSAAGVYRSIDVWPNGSEDRPYTAPFEIRPQLDALLQWADSAQQTASPIIFAADLHQRFVAIHPFIDGNGRTSRLLMNLVLVNAGYPVINILPDTASRNAYIAALETARGGDPEPFERLIAAYVKRALVYANNAVVANGNNKGADQ
ncbi:Fic family protein [Schleiferilactobacillus harbinensis]|jgi:Fic family protein|uniref:Fic family protein n=1 Tax=Schleiferilactobacillus harbinensis TaxID=304207 RepID=UPI00242E662C|nr:Fic family protein [Schleiferilactobacillus harbinensis]MCI1687215.1 Fic family protein [Schleiferilactobacillus harbinensis]MCI1783021.1 Fic family protein [Schleiferilactobacillus harbinensis]MCI1851193.1 Fic family protein [Schleiferilactobacillus harbinensis]